MRVSMRTYFMAIVAAFAALASVSAGEVRIPDRVPNTPEIAIERDFIAGNITRADRAGYRVLETFQPQALPAKYRTGISIDGKACRTPQVLRTLADWKDLSEEAKAVVPAHLVPGRDRSGTLVRKGTLQSHVAADAFLAKTNGGDPGAAPGYNMTYATTNFLIHWTNGTLRQSGDANSNGIPDMIEWCGAFMETSWTWYVSQGYRTPPGTDNNYYNVYFDDLTSMGAWGYCDPIDWPDRHSRSYIVLTTDFSGGELPDGSVIPAKEQMRATSTHELFHAIQFAYDTLEDIWWMEVTATWVMDVVGPEWDANNIYTGWVQWYLYYPEVSLDADYWSSHWYMDVMWPVYLVSHLDPDGSIVREIWELCEGPTNALSANKTAITGYAAGGFPEVFRDFLVANYEQDYPEASEQPVAYGNLYYIDTHYSYPTGQRSPSTYIPEGLGANYVGFRPPTSGAPDLIVNFWGTDSAATWRAMLVGAKRDGSFTRRDMVTGGSEAIAYFRADYSKAVLISTPMLEGFVDGQTFRYKYSAALGTTDASAPTPDPMTWQSEPHAVSNSSVAMTAATASDANGPVTYFFGEVTGNSGGSSSSWQEATSFTDGGLSTNTQYGYRVRARDASASLNQTQWSSTVYCYTLANTPSAPVLADPSPTKLYVTVPATDGNPSGTLYAVYNQTTSKYVGADGMPADTAWYATRATWTAFRATGLASSTTFTFKVKARNGDGIETAFGGTASATTLAADTQAPVVSGAATSPTWIKEGLTASAFIVATADDRTTGASDIVQAEYYLGADPGEGHGTSMAAADGQMNSPLEALSVSINTSGWTIAGSPYHVYIRARDEAGRWSAPSHLVINVVDGITPTAVTDLSAQARAEDLSGSVALSVESATSEDPAHPADNLVDMNDSHYWASEQTDAASPVEIVLAFAQAAVVDEITLAPSDRLDLFPGRFRVKIGDGSNWTTVVSEYDYIASPGANTWQFQGTYGSKAAIVIEQTQADTSTDKYGIEIAEAGLRTDLGGKRSVEIAWTAPSDVGPLGRASSYVVKYNTSSAQMASFVGTVGGDESYVPSVAGQTDTMLVSGLEPGTTYYVALESVDEYENFSAISNIASVSTLFDPVPYVTLLAPQDESELSLVTPSEFSWTANFLDTFKLQFSNVPTFPQKSYKDALGRTARTLTLSVKKGLTSLTPSASQWKQIKAVASGMDGTLYWRVQATSSTNKLLGIRMSRVFHEYGFSHAAFPVVDFGPGHQNGDATAVWPNNIPQLWWTVDQPTYTSYFIDMSASPDINIYDKSNTLVFPSPNLDRTWFKPTAAQWKAIKQKIAGPNGGLVYWRVRGRDAEKAYSAASEPVIMLIDLPSFSLRKPAPRRDGTVKPGETFVFEWSLNAEGYPYAEIQVSITAAFTRGTGTVSLKKLVGTDRYELTAKDVTKVQSMCTKAGTDTFYWRIVATDVDKTMSAASDAQEVVISEQPAGGGA